MPGYLDLVGSPVVLGRDLQPLDSAGLRSRAIPVVIGDDMARQVWGTASPIGARIERVENGAPLSLDVVGVFREEVAARGHARNPFTVIVPPAAGLAVLLLCALGLYAVVAFAVGQRTSEIAVRMAVGARARQVVAQFAVDGLRLTTIGVLVGLPLSLVGLRQVVALSPDLPDVSVALVTVAIEVMTVAGLASWLPANRASNVDPAVILRKE